MSKIINSSEMFINMKNTPIYDPKKHYFDQSKDVLQFYNEERSKIINGVKIGDYWVHPWMYYHLNFFKTPIPQPDGTEDITVPQLDDNFLYVVESYHEADMANKGMLLFGCRGFAKSTIISSLISWIAITKANGVSSIVGGSDGDLNAISSLFEKNFNNIHPAFFMPRLKSDWNSEIEFGLKEKTGTKRYTYSQIMITNADDGKKKKSEKGAGLSPVGFVADEIGKWNPVQTLRTFLPSFKTQYGMKLVPVLSGTSGNEELSKPAKKILSNPAAYDLLLTNWDRLNRNVPEEAITWKNSYNKKFSIFVPGQMSYRLSVPKLKSNLADFLHLDNKHLKKIGINVTDWENADKGIEEKLLSIPDEDERNKERMYYPRDIDDCFLTQGNNPFPKKVIRRRIQELEDAGKIGASIEIYRGNKWYEREFSANRRAEVSHGGGVADAPIILFSAFPEEQPLRGIYVSGLDGYKIDVSATDSLGSMYVLKRRHLSPNEPCETIAASYTARPEKMRDFFSNCEKLHDVWNAECLMESIDMGFKQYLENKGREYDVLAPYINKQSLLSKGAAASNAYSKFGLYPHKANNEYRFNLLVDYCREEHTIDMDETGNPVIKLGVEYIDDVDLLKEMLNWHPGGNFDRITAFSHALVLARELDNKKVMPDKKKDKDKLSDKEIAKKMNILKGNKYGHIRGMNKY